MPKFRATETRAKTCRITCFSDTFGVESNNGVGRFLDDLRTLAAQSRLPLELVVPGKGGEEEGVHVIKAPSFALPGYRDLRISMPLEHQRKTVIHELKGWRPDVLHVSTPGPFGCFGVSLAQQLRLPLVGVYHTDFPSYARTIVQSELARWIEQPQLLLEPLMQSLGSFLNNYVDPYVRELQEANPEFDSDLETIARIAHKNYRAVGGGTDAAELGGRLASAATARALRRFYAYFTLVIARSPAQRAELEHRIGIAPERIRCLTPGTNIIRFHPEYRDRELWESHGIPREAFVALYVGRATREKNFDFVLDAWRRVQAGRNLRDRDMRLVVVGRGETETLERAAELPGIHLIGAQQGRSLSALYASADVLLFPSVTETLGQVGLEAGASGLPVIVSAEGGPRMYVRDGQTGFVISTRDAEAWADCVFKLSRDPELRDRLAKEARRHVAEHHALDASLRSYWGIHREAVELQPRKQTRPPRRKGLARGRGVAGSGASRAGLLVITDYHAGKRFGTAKQRKQKEAALECMFRLAIDENLDIVFGGDFGDHGARPERAQADFSMLRQVRCRSGLATTPVFVRGNHDYGYSDRQLSDLVGGCRVHDSLVYTHKASGVTVTHGHILGLHRVQDVIRTLRGSEEIEAALREDILDEELTPSVIAYDLANLVESYTRRKGLSGLGTFWEGLFETRGLFADNLLAWGQRTGAKDERTWKLIASLVGSQNDIETAGALGTACGSWATIFGHTHEPLAQTWQGSSPELGPPAHVVGNAGNINRKRPSCVVARFPDVGVYRYCFETNKLKVSHHAAGEETSRQRTLDKGRIAPLNAEAVSPGAFAIEP